MGERRRMTHRVTPCATGAMMRSLYLMKLEGEIIRMYSSPKIIASLDAKIVLATALGHKHDWQGSQCDFG